MTLPTPLVSPKNYCFGRFSYAVLSLKSRLLRPINLWRMRGKGEKIDKIHREVLESHYDHCWLCQLFFLHFYCFSPKTNNHLLCSIPTKIHQIWEIGLNLICRLDRMLSRVFEFSDPSRPLRVQKFVFFGGFSYALSLFLA